MKTTELSKSESLAATEHHSARAWFAALVLLLMCASARGQVNSGSTGADGAFNPTTNTVVDMSDHPTGIYHYTAVNIPAGVVVTFTPNAANTPVIWLVQSNCVISGAVDVSGQSADYLSDTGNGAGGLGGPSGFRGGNGGINANGGQGPGGGAVGPSGEAAAFGTLPSYNFQYPVTNGTTIYGNQYLLPLIGGSGGGGGTNFLAGGGGGGGVFLIAASQAIELSGSIDARGGNGAVVRFGYSAAYPGGGGSGGAVRLVAPRLTGRGRISVSGGYGPGNSVIGGQGRVRFDIFENNFGGTISGVFSQGFQPIILPSTGTGTQLAVASIAGVPVAASPAGVQATPDAIIAGQQSNPVVILVRCTNLPLNTPVTVTVKPANGATISAVGYNTAGTLASSTATVSLNMPRGGGLIYATAATAP